MAGEYVPIQDQGCDTKDDGSGTLKQFETTSFPACLFHTLAMLGCPEQSDLYEIYIKIH